MSWQNCEGGILKSNTEMSPPHVNMNLLQSGTKGYILHCLLSFDTFLVGSFSQTKELVIAAKTYNILHLQLGSGIIQNMCNFTHTLLQGHIWSTVWHYETGPQKVCNVRVERKTWVKIMRKIETSESITCINWIWKACVRKSPLEFVGIILSGHSHHETYVS